MPSGNSCRQTSVSTQLARFRRAAWKKVSRTFTCCCRPRVDRDAVCDEYISLPDATNTTPNLSSKYGPHPGHMTLRNNKSGAQHQSPKVIPNIIRSPHSHKTLRNTWVASNNSGSQSHVTLVTTFAKDQTYPLSKVTPDKITRDFSVASTSLGALSFLCRTPEGGSSPIASSGNLPLPRTLLREVPTFSTLYEMLVSSTSTEEALNPSESSGALFYFYIFSGKAFTLSLSYEMLPFREVCIPLTSSGGLLFTCTSFGDVHTPLTSSGALRLSFRTTRELCTPLTSSVTLCVSSQSSGALRFIFKTAREVFSPSTTSGTSSFPSTPHGKVFHPSNSYGLLPLPCRTHGDLFTPLTSFGVLQFPCTSFGLVFTPSSSGALPVSSIPSRKAINLLTSNGNWPCPRTSLVKVVPTSASCGVLVFSCTSSRKAFTDSAFSEELSFTYTSPAEVNPSNSSGALSFPHRTPEEKIVPSTSSGTFCFPYRSPGKVSSTSASPKALPLLFRTPDGVLAPSTSSGILPLPCRVHGWIVTPSTSSGVLFLSFTSRQKVFSPSTSSGVLPYTCTSLGEVLMPSTLSGALSVPSRSHREVFGPPTTSGAFSFPCTSSGQLVPPPTSSGARLAFCIPSGEALNPSTSFGNHQCPRKLPKEVVTPLTPSNESSFPYRSPGENVLIPSNSSGTFTCSITLTSSEEELPPLASSRVFSPPLKALIPATPSKVFQSPCIPPRLSPPTMFICLSLCKIMTDTYSVSTLCEQLFTRSVPVKSRVSMALAATGLYFTPLVNGKTISTSQRTQPRSKISKKGLPCLLPSLHSQTSSQAEVWDIEGFGYEGSFSSSRNGPEFDKCYNFTNHTNVRPTEQVFLSFNWVGVAKNEYLGQSIKSNSLPMYASSSSSEKASPAKYLIFASSLPALIGGEGFIQQTANCQSECFILSDSTVFSNANHQKLTPSYPILVSHQGLSFPSGCSASWDNWGSFNTSSGYIPSARPLTRSWSCDGLNDLDQLDQKIRSQSLPVDVSGKDDRAADSRFSKSAFSLPVIDCEDRCPENTASFNSGCFNLSRSSIATNSGSRRTLDLTVSFQKDAWSSCSAGDGNLGRTASSLSACFNVSDATISTAFPKDAQQFLGSNLHSNPQANPSNDVISSQGTSRNNHSKSADRFPSKATGSHETSNYYPKPRKETSNSGQRPQAAGPVIGLGDAPHLVNNILKGLSAKGNYQTFKSVPPTCPIIRPLNLTGVPDKRNRPTVLLSFKWVTEDEYLDTNIKSNSLPMCASSSSSEKASPAKYLIFASSLPALIGREGFIQQTASCQSECFILSDSTVFSNASHQKLTPSYPILVSHQGLSFPSGYSASWNNWGSFNTSSGFIPSARPLTRSWSCDGLNDLDQLDQKIRSQSLPVDVSGKDDRAADSKFSKAALSLPVIAYEDKCPENTASFNSGCFNLSRSSIATNSGSRRTLDLTVSFQKDAWSSCSAGDGNLGRTASSLSACFNVSDATISTASPKDAQQFLSNLHSNPQANPSNDVISSQGTSRNNHSKSADRFPSKATGSHETSNHHPKPRKEASSSGQRPQAAGPVIGLGDAPHLVNNILKGLSVEGNHQTFMSIPSTCPIIRPLDLTGVPDKRNRPTVLGEGSFGVVQLVKHMPTMKLCAVKIPREDLKRDRMYENFYLEVNVLSSLRGLDCVPQLLGVSRAGSNLDMPILVQEFIGDPFTYESITLQIAILKKLLSNPRAVCIALQVCNGIREIHSRGILHCDLKVDNIMLLPGFIDAKFPKVKIIDFGMAVTLNGPPRYEDVPVQYQDEVGKRCLHIAPEVLRGRRPYSVASEIYGLGLILKNLSVLSGKYPEDLGQKCMGQEDTRPQLKDLINSLESKVSSHYNPP